MTPVSWVALGLLLAIIFGVWFAVEWANYSYMDDAYSWPTGNRETPQERPVSHPETDLAIAQGEGRHYKDDKHRWSIIP